MAARYPEAPQPVDPIEEHINHFFDQMVERMVACANQRRLTLIAEANEKRLEMAARVTLRNQKEQELLATKAEVERKITTNELREFQERIIVDIEAKLAEVRLPQPETRLVFRGECEQLEQLLLGLGAVLEEAVPVIPRYHEMRQIVAVGKEGQNPGELWNPRGVAIDENSNHIYVTDRDPAMVSIFSESGDFLNTFTHEQMEHPYGIAIHRNNVYVTDEAVHGVFHFKIESDMRLDAALVGRGSDGGMFNSPGQLAVSTNGDVFIVDCKNHRIQILDGSLYFQRSIKHDSMHNPSDIKLTINKIYVLSFADSHSVHIFSHAGDKIRSFITCGDGMQVTEAWFFCLDAHENLIISDGGAYSVKVFSPDGTLLHTIGGFKEHIRFVNPHGIALTKQLKLVIIAPDDNLKLQIYSS